MNDCQIKTCTSNYRKRNVHFHRFPKKNYARLLKWKEACGREDVNIVNGRICSIHFDSAAYHLDTPSRSQKNRLKSDAVPTLNLGLSISEGIQDLDESAIVLNTAMNTILSEEQMEASTSRHSLNLETPESSLFEKLPKNFLDKSNDPPMEIGKKELDESRLQNAILKKQHVNDNNRKEYEIRENEMGREQQNEKERDETTMDEHYLYEEDQDTDSENIKDRFKLKSGKTKIHECDQCGRTFLLHQMLMLHIQRVHRNRPYECDDCKKRFLDKWDLLNHKSIHLDKKPFSCSVCHKKYRLKDYLRKHEKIHINEMHYTCQHCNRRFVTIEECKKHEDSEHKKVKPFQCDICDNRFVYKQSLQRHMVLHESNLFTCNYCTKAFHTKLLLNQHLLTHVDVRPYVCKICLKTFSLFHHLVGHIKINHSGLKNTEKYYSDAQSEAQQLTVSSPPAHGPKYKIIFSISYKIPK